MSFVMRAAVAIAALSMVGVTRGVAQKKDPYLLTQEEIAPHKDIRTAFEAVQQLRPRFLRGHKSYSSETAMSSSASKPEAGGDPAGGSSASDGILVVVNGARRGGVAELRSIPIDQVESIHFIKSDEARGIYGPDQSGVIEVKTSLQARTPGTG